MNVTIISTFRNAVGPQMDRYFCQIDALANVLARRKPFTRLSLILGYGDSDDGTGEALFEAAAAPSGFPIGALLIDVSHGGPVYGSIEDPVRFKQLAYVGNRLLECVDDTADVVGIVESDLIWEPQTLVQLVEDLEHLPPPYGAVAPMVMDGPESFYDVFAFRKNGQRFTKQPPYHERLPLEVEQNPNLTNVISLVEVDSAGSVLFMDADLARKARFINGQAIVGLCEDIYNHGGSVWLDANATVYHP